jgi:hypothetical protein
MTLTVLAVSNQALPKYKEAALLTKHTLLVIEKEMEQ